MIPVYLIVSGTIGLFLSISQCHHARETHIMNENSYGSSEPACRTANLFSSLVTLFAFIWFVIGNVYVFKAQSIYDPERPAKSPLYCHPALFDFAVSSIIAHYMLLLIMVLLLLLSACGAMILVNSWLNDSTFNSQTLILCPNVTFLRCKNAFSSKALGDAVAQRSIWKRKFWCQRRQQSFVDNSVVVCWKAKIQLSLKTKELCIHVSCGYNVGVDMYNFTCASYK